RDHDQFARLQIEVRPVPDRPEAIFMNGLGMRRADRVELAPRLQPVLAESLVANRLAARGAIMAHRFSSLRGGCCASTIARRQRCGKAALTQDGFWRARPRRRPAMSR